jgi:hypothetical protein
MQAFLIEATTKVADVLSRFPQLEDELIDFAPPFAKLRNPLLRNSIGKVATLKQAAAVAGVPVTDLVNHLRTLVGQPLLEGDAGPEVDYFPAEPEWVAGTCVVGTLDERVEDPEQTEMAIVRVSRAARGLDANQAVELLTTFLPAPGIEVMRRKGHATWCKRDADGTVHTLVRGK